MKFAVALSLVSVAVASVLEQRACAGNNCNRAVTGTRDGLPAMSLRSADCSSFLLTTVTPAPTTVTVTVYDDDEPTAAAGKRDLINPRQATVTATDIPTYAAVCSSAERYASACNCFGVTGTVSTAPTPTVTVTTTIDYCDDL